MCSAGIRLVIAVFSVIYLALAAASYSNLTNRAETRRWFTFPRVIELILAVWVIICEVIFLFFFMNSSRRRVGVLSGPPKVYYDLSDLSNRYNEAYNINTIAIIFVVVRLVDFFRVNQALSIFVAVFYKVRYMA